MVNSRNWVHVRHQENHMATTFDLRISCAADRRFLAKRVLEDIHTKIKKLEFELSEFIPNSSIYNLNKNCAETRILLSDEAIELFELSEKLRRETFGFFDCTAKTDGRKSMDIAPCLKWDKLKREVWKTEDVTHVGFGAIGKGFALDQGRLILELNGFSDFLLSAGGSSIIFSGFAGPQVPWKWGWAFDKPSEDSFRGIDITHESGHPISIGVSGTYEKGQHLLNPQMNPKINSRVNSGSDLPHPKQSGEKSGLTSTLVAHPSAAVSDALSTALFVSGWNTGTEFLSRFPSHTTAAAMADSNGVTEFNSTFQKWWMTKSLNGIALFLFIVGFGIWQNLLVKNAFSEDLDLSKLGDGENTFTPYITERSIYWALLPLFSLVLVAIHLKSNRLKSNRRKIMPQNLFSKSELPARKASPMPTAEPTAGSHSNSKTKSTKSLVAFSFLWLLLDRGLAVEIEPQGKSLMAILGSKKVGHNIFDIGGGKKVETFYSKNESGQPITVGFIEKGLYPPNCTHTWSIGVDYKTGRIKEMRVIEMSCPHAFPTKEASFLKQFVGKGIADAPKMKTSVHTIAKATGSSILAAEAIQRSLENFSKIKGKF